MLVPGWLTCFEGISGCPAAKSSNHSINETGLRMGENCTPTSISKSFAVQTEDAINSIVLLPLGDLCYQSVYIAPQKTDNVLDVISLYLPFEDKPTDLVDRAMLRNSLLDWPSLYL